MDDSEAFRLADRGVRLLAAPETPELVTALRAADYARLPVEMKADLDSLTTSISGGFDGLNSALDRVSRSLTGLLYTAIFGLGLVVGIAVSTISNYVSLLSR